MKLKRGILFGIILWVLIFILWSIIMFLPYLKEHQTIQYIVWWIIEIPLVLSLGKWYFKQRKPRIKEGFFLGLVALLVVTILDIAITVPFFVKSFSKFYGDWRLIVGLIELVALTTLAGWEFDGPVAITEKKELHN